jgi:hypothetical protein
VLSREATVFTSSKVDCGFKPQPGRVFTSSKVDCGFKPQSGRVFTSITVVG